jgi:hypothetical protein
MLELVREQIPLLLLRLINPKNKICRDDFYKMENF